MISKIRLLRAMLEDILIIRSNRLYSQSRAFFLRVFRKEYDRYKKWIEPSVPSSTPIDVIIPVIEKDLDVLPLVITGARKHIQHPINHIYIVAPAVDAIMTVASENECVFVDEKTICSTPKAEVNFVVNGKDRSGWIYQQLLKFNFDKVAYNENYLVIDADTFFVRDICFERKGRHFFDFSDEFHTPYHAAYKLLTGYEHTLQVSFVSHYMLFNKRRLGELKKHIEQYTSMPLAQAIMNLKGKVLDYSAFSEYETYANFCIQNYPGQHTIRYWFNYSVSRNLLASASTLQYEPAIKSVSFHSHNTK